jgi:hypothetical protein
MRIEYPRAIDRYIDFFGEGTQMASVALDTWPVAIPDSPTAERGNLAARDDQPRP